MTQADCLFCKIARGEIPATIVFKGDGVTAFRDINPQAPVHILLIPDEHLDGPADVTAASEQIAGKLIRIAAEVARSEGIAESGYRQRQDDKYQQKHDERLPEVNVQHTDRHLLGRHQLCSGRQQWSIVWQARLRAAGGLLGPRKDRKRLQLRGRLTVAASEPLPQVSR